MADLDVRAAGEHAYDVTVTENDGAASDYRVSVPGSWLERLGLDDTDEPLLVRSALELLLDGHGGQLTRTFTLDDAERSYPGFYARLQAAAAR